MLASTKSKRVPNLLLQNAASLPRPMQAKGESRRENSQGDASEAMGTIHPPPAEVIASPRKESTETDEAYKNAENALR